MIPINYITQWQKYAPWALQSQVEQDLVLSRALVQMYKNPLIQKSLAFRGGTALNKLYCNSSARYSEDIDLVQIYNAPIGDVMTAVRESVDPWLGKAKWKQTSRSVKFIYRFESEDKPSVPLRLKIEINTTESFSFFGYKEKNYTVDNRWFSGEAKIKTYDLEELMGTKFRALYQRAKGRDLYDLWMAITRLGVDCGEILEVFKYYNNQQKISISRAEYEKNLIDKQASQDFLTDAKHVLPARMPWDPNVAFQVVSDRLVKRLPGEAWKGVLHPGGA